MAFDILWCSIDLDKAKRGDSITIHYSDENGQTVEAAGLVISWTEEIVALQARRIAFARELDNPFQRKYELIHFYNANRQDRVEYKD